jgi:deazaflavin-dependent oxidoreductase (nitroreductase family)
VFVAQRYVVPNWFTRHVFNRFVAGLTLLGVSVWGSRVLEVRGRKSGQPRRVPVNLLTLEGTRYLVAPRGHTHWVRNLRVAGEGQLLLGRRRERFVASEISDADKEPILRSYLRRWKWEVGQFFGGVDESPRITRFSESRHLRRSRAAPQNSGGRLCRRDCRRPVPSVELCLSERSRKATRGLSPLHGSLHSWCQTSTFVSCQ